MLYTSKYTLNGCKSKYMKLSSGYDKSTGLDNNTEGKNEKQ